MAAILLVAAAAAAPVELRRQLPVPGSEGRQSAVLAADDEVYLEAEPLKGEGLLAFARRFCENEEHAAEIRRLNDAGGRLLAGQAYRVPLQLLAQAHRRRVLQALFPEDRAEAGGWRHRVDALRALPEESLWRIAERFTGSGQHFRAIRASNRLPDDSVYPGQELLIPAGLLRPVFRQELEARTGSPVASAAVPAMSGAVPVASTAVPAAVTAELRSTDHRLEYGRDDQGEFAVYRLKPGEALYSSVVVRFTGRIYAVDVNALAAEIAERNGVVDVTDMPIGFPVRIPFDMLEPEFLPQGHPRRLEHEASLRASEQFSNPVRSLDLAGITVILDAGHGGRDSGATSVGVWESVYVYDIMLRLKAYLERETAAEVFTTTRDGASFTVLDRDQLPYSRGHQVLTSPPYSLMEDHRVGVNLRWYLANSLYRKVRREGRDSEKVVFISIHADSLHPSLRGAMAYIPDAQLRQGSYEKSGAVYTSRREVKEKPRVSYSWRHRVQSEGLSRQLAEQVITSFRSRGLAVHPDQPVRQKIYRGRRPWVPAVLRYNEIPAEILLEVCNLANASDRKLLTSRKFRQEAALALADGIRAYYGSADSDGDLRVAQRSR